jgi:hypothetical protein
MYLCISGIDIASFYDFSVGLWMYSYGVVPLFFILLLNWKW